jgi:hypothetical protein
MSDAIFNRAAELDSPAWEAVAVTPSDEADISLAPCRALYVGGAGDVAVVMAGGEAAVTFAGVTAGAILPIRVDRVNSTNTTATAIVALY